MRQQKRGRKKYFLFEFQSKSKALGDKDRREERKAA
jgi:hypothetical protein